MIKNYIQVAIRYFIKDKIYASINIIGFILSLAFALLLIAWVMDEFSYERNFSESEHIYRVIKIAKVNDAIIKTPRTYMPLAQALMNNFPFIDEATFIKHESVYALGYNEYKMDCNASFVDSSFFKVFDFTFVEGSPENLFLSRDGIILTKETASKLFGEKKALGKELTHHFYSKKIPFKVVGVIEMPKNTHLGFDVLIWVQNSQYSIYGIFGTNWRKGESTVTYLKFNKNYIINDEERSDMSLFLKNFKNTASRLWFQPILDIHLHQDFDFWYDQNRGKYQVVMLYSLLAILLLIIAVINFINLNMARVSNRFKEIAIRKIQGAKKGAIASQVFTETILQSVIAVVLALVFTELIKPIFNNIVGKDLLIPYSFELIVLLLILGVILGIFAGIYPALYLSGLSPMNIFSQKNPKSQGHLIIKILSTLQFSSAAAMLIAGLIISQQLQFINHKDLGIEKENIVTIKTGLWYGVDAFKEELLSNPNIIAATAVMTSPDNFRWKMRNIKWDGMEGNEGVEMTSIMVDGDFQKTYNPVLIQGEFLYSDFDKYWTKDTAAISIPTVINETAKKIIGRDDPIGTRLNERYVVVGVVKDFHFQSMHESIQPLMMHYNPEALFEVDIRVNPDKKQRAIVYIKETYLKHRPERTFEYQFFDDLLDQKYQDEKRLGRIVFWFIIICMVISLLGVIGLSVLNTTRRTKEIAIRKVNGATTNQVIQLMSRQYIIYLVLSFVLGGIVSTWLMNEWLQNFAYHTNIGFVSYALPAIILTLTTLTTVYLVVNKAARANPVKSLRYE